MKRIKTWLATVAVLLGSMAVNAATFEDWTSTNKSHSSTSSHTYTFTATGGSILSFDWSVSSEANCDKLIVTLDGSTILEKSGSLNSTYTATLGSGEHTLVVKYTKDGSVSNGSDQAKIFNINIAEPITLNGVNYILKVDNTATVYGLSTDTSAALVIDSLIAIDGVTYNVTSISTSAFENCTNLTSITIPNSIMSIENAAFKGCSALNEVIIEDGNTVLTLGYNASNQGLFYDCPLETLYLGRNLSYNTSSSYGYSPFYNKTTLASVSIGNEVSSVASNAFNNCNGLTNLLIGYNVTSFGSNAFYGCTGTLTLNSDIPAVSSSSNGVFYGSKFTDVIIEDSVSSIGAYAFYNCNKLESITISKNVKSIGNYAFYGCTSLKDVTFEDGSSILSLGNNGSGSGAALFYSCPLEKLYLGRALGYNTTNGNSPFYNKTKLASVVIGDSVSSIESYLFSGCIGIVSMKIPDSVKSLGNYAFYSCSELADATIGNEVTSIGEYTFYGCTNLKDITIGNKVSTIGGYAFYGCSNLASIKIPESVISIGNYAFYSCTSLKELCFEEGPSILSLGYNSSNTGLFNDCPLETLYLGRSLNYNTSYSSGYSPFYNKTTLTSVEFGDNVTSIENYAFYGCSGITSIALPDSVKTIGDYAFYNCRSLVALTMGNEVTSIGNYAFYDCREITSIELPDSVTTIGYNAFYNCNSLTSFTMGKDVTSIGSSAFYGCNKLTSIIIPGSMTSIGNAAFGNCSSLKDIIFEDGEATLALDYNTSRQGLFYDCPLESVYLGRNLNYSTSSSYGYSPFYNKTSLTSIVFGDKVTSIGNYAFYGCSGITSIMIPDSVTSIGSYSFYNNSGIAYLTIGRSVATIGSYAFSNCSKLYTVMNRSELMLSKGSSNHGYVAYYARNVVNKVESSALIDNFLFYTVDGTHYLASYMGDDVEVVLPESYNGESYQIGSYAFYDRKGITSIVIPDNVTSIGDYAFYNCSGLTSIVLPDAVASIGNYAFYGCAGITSIMIPDATTFVGDYAFYNCSSLTSLTMGKGITSIGNSAFFGCIKLTSITIPSSVYSIGNSSFDNCSGIKEVIIEDGEETLSLGYNTYSSSGTGQGLFYDCPLETVYLGRSLSYDASSLYGYSPFYNKTSITSVAFGDKVTSLSDYSFYGCTGISSIELPNSVTSIGSCVFYNCSGISSLEIPEFVTTIGDYAFYGCSGLTSMKIPNSVASIGDYAFYNCSGITSITIPDAVTSIGNSTFCGCSGLTSIVIPDSVISIGNYAFSGCSGIASIVIPDGVTSIGNHAFDGCSGLTSLKIGEGVTTIGSSAFYGCSGITSIVIPNGVTSIGNSAFYNCSKLYTIINRSNLAFSTGSSNYGYVAYYARNLVNNAYIIDDFVFYTTDGKHYLASYIGDKTEIVLPSNFNGENYAIRSYAFYNCSDLTSIVIPDGVTSIGHDSFYGCSGLTSIVIPNGVTTIGDGAFADCGNLISIAIPEGVETIGSYAFQGCKSLISITIPASVASINNGSFDGCISLVELVLEDGNNVLSLGYDYANYNGTGQGLFYDCPLEIVYLGRNLEYTTSYNEGSRYGYSPFAHNTTLVNLTIGNCVTSIGLYAFYGCSGITSITIPKNVIKIYSWAFSGCAIKNAILEDGNQILSSGIREIAGSSGYYWSVGSGLFDGCPLESVHLGRNLSFSASEKDGIYSPFNGNLTTITIGDSVTMITDYTFHGCKGLASIQIPQNITSIGNNAFVDCVSLEKIVFEDGDQTLSLGGCRFYDCPLDTIYLGRTLNYYSSDCSPFYKQGQAPQIIIGNQVLAIGEYLFYDNDGLTDVTIPKSVKTIGSYAFANCSNLASITISNSVESVGNYAFDNCGGLKEVVFEDGANTLTLGYNSYGSSSGQGLFYDCPLETLYIGRNLSYNTGNYYGYSPFYNGTDLTSITIGDSVKNIPDYLFSSCNSLSSVTLPNSVISIGNSAFSGCNGLSSLVIPNSITSIGDYSFSGCTGLSSLTIGDGVTSIGSSAFYECNGLTSLVIPDGVSSIGGYAFYGCSDLESAIIGDGVISIGSSAFSDCVALKDLTIGSSVSSIESSAFAGCNEIESIYALNTKAITCNESIFATDAYNNATLYVPEGREQAYAKATPWSKFYIKTMVTPTESFEVKIGSAGYATLYLDYAVERPRGVEAYYISRVSGDVAVLKAVWDYIPANTGVILRGAKGTYTFTSTDEDVEVISDNLLRGTVVDKDIRAQKNTTYYALGRVDGVVGLYRAELEDGYFFNNANKAYLALTSETEEDDDSDQLARSLILRFPNGSTTTIAEVMGGDENEEVIYDMQGRRLKEITEPGVYIINGRKVWR